MSAVAGTRRTMKELVDGTIRVQIDIDPKFRAAFLEMFPSIDMPCALAPLRADFEREPEPEGKSSWKELGPLCQSAIELCKTDAFQQWVATMVPASGRNTPEKHAAEYIRSFCQVGSRRELDEDDAAKASFTEMMAEYRKWWEARGGK